MGKRRQEVFVDRIDFAVNPLLVLHVGFESRRCSAGSVSSPNAFGQFDAAGVELEAFGDARSSGCEAGERGLARGIGMKHGGPADPEIGLDPH